MYDYDSDGKMNQIENRVRAPSKIEKAKHYDDDVVWLIGVIREQEKLMATYEMGAEKLEEAKRHVEFAERVKELVDRYGVSVHCVPCAGG